jgi:hypothetical protein
MAEDYMVQADDSVASIARVKGFVWQTLWNDGANAQLKDKRHDPDTLMPGDILHIPDLTPAQESKPTDQQHQFKVKNRQAKFKLTLVQQPKDASKAQTAAAAAAEDWKFTEQARAEAKPEAMTNVPYELQADGNLVAKGFTDGSGNLSAPVAPNAQSGLLILNKGQPDEWTIELHFREMAPLTEPAGVGRRLYNLGFACSTTATDITQDISEAIRRFRAREGLPAGGDLDDATRNKLKDVYGG